MRLLRFKSGLLRGLAVLRFEFWHLSHKSAKKLSEWTRKRLKATSGYNSRKLKEQADARNRLRDFAKNLWEGPSDE